MENEKQWEIRKYYGKIEAHEISVDWNEWNFLVIYGKHINGWFIAVPNWKICVEATTPNNVNYNASKLGEKFSYYERGEAIALAIKEHWEGLKNG